MERKKYRKPLEADAAAKVLFQSDRTCCVCNERGKPVQIHHVDENPANNEQNNLAVLCLECHDSTMIKGGFGRKLNAAQVIIFRDEWYARVQARRDRADELASIRTVTGSTESLLVADEYIEYKKNDDPDLLRNYLDKILIVQKAQINIAKTKWDTGVTATMNHGSSDMIDFYEEVLLELMSFYPAEHFGKSIRAYISEQIALRGQWHRSVLEPDGFGTGGTIISTLTGGRLMDDIKKMVVDIVNSLCRVYEIDGLIDVAKWRKQWLR